MDCEQSGIPTTATTPATRPKRRWHTLSLRVLMLLIAVVAGWLLCETNLPRAQRRAVAVITHPCRSIPHRPLSGSMPGRHAWLALGLWALACLLTGDRPARVLRSLAAHRPTGKEAFT
jgi:hypothetical protein